MRVLKCLRNIEIIRKSKGGQWTMNILNKQIDSIYDRQKIYIVNIRIIANRMQKVKGMRTRKITATSGKDVLGITKEIKKILILCISLILQWSAGQLQEDMLRSMVKRWN